MDDRAARSVDPRASQVRSGHTEVSASIVVDATMDAPLLVDTVPDRIRRRWPSDGSAGVPPVPVLLDAADFAGGLEDIADRAYGSGEPLCRILLSAGREPRAAVAGHHAAFDGLGLLGVLSVIADHPISSSVRGVATAPGPRGRVARVAGPAYRARRLGEALFFPPTRIAPDGGTPQQGDHLLRVEGSPEGLTTADLLSAAVRGVRRWNRRAGRSGGRMVIAVGASRRPGATPSIGQDATWFRLRVRDDSPEALRRALHTRAPEPRITADALARAPAAWVARNVAPRMGSTLLVSNLGRLEPGAPVTSLAFFPWAHGRSGVSLGCATAGGRSVICLRARRADFTRDGALALLNELASGLPG